MDRPSPRDAPVTSATLPSSEKSFVTFDLRFAPVYYFVFRVRLIQIEASSAFSSDTVGHR